MIKTNPAIQIFEPAGILDGIKGNQLRREITDVLEKGADIVLIDLENVSFMDSSGLGSLLLSYKTVRGAGSHFYICSMNDQIKMLFQLTKMERVLTPLANRDEFNKTILGME